MIEREASGISAGFPGRIVSVSVDSDVRCMEKGGDSRFKEEAMQGSTKKLHPFVTDHSTNRKVKPMKKIRILFVVLIVVTLFITTSVASASPPDQRNFAAPLSGRQEVPVRDTNGTGVATFKLNKEGTALSFKLIVANIDGVTQAHIHCGAEGVNGPVVAFLFGFVAEGVTVNGVLAEGTITTVIPRAPSPECPEGVANFEELLERMRSGDTYVNVHTLEFPPGEIRGQIK